MKTASTTSTALRDLAATTTGEVQELLETAAAELDYLRGEVTRIATLPELEWVNVISVLMQVLAEAARGGFRVNETAAVDALNRGQVYVSRVVAERDELRRHQAAMLRAITDHDNACYSYAVEADYRRRLRKGAK